MAREVAARAVGPLPAVPAARPRVWMWLRRASTARVRGGPMRHWNYRVVHRVQDVAGVGPMESYFLIDAYYGDDGELVNWSLEVFPGGDTPDELRDDMDRMARALTLPVLEYEDLPQPKEEDSDG